MSFEGMIRVSCNGFTNIRLCEGQREDQVLAVLNRGQLNKKRRLVFSPIGGCYKLNEGIGLYLRNEFGAESQPGKEGELRLYIPPSNLEGFMQWYDTGEGRETNPSRELEEELCIETDVLERSPTCNYTGGVRVVVVRPAVNPEAEGDKTYYVFEVHDTTIDEDSERALRETLGTPGRFVGLVDKDEIREGYTRGGRIQVAGDVLSYCLRDFTVGDVQSSQELTCR